LWSDIDYGGFVMFSRLSCIYLDLKPYMMDKTTFKKYVNYGYERHSDDYYKNLSKLMNDERFALFNSVIQEIILNKKTVEQEIMLSDI
jgi:hypothetical protein